MVAAPKPFAQFMVADTSQPPLILGKIRGWLENTASTANLRCGFWVKLKSLRKTDRTFANNGSWIVLLKSAIWIFDGSV